MTTAPSRSAFALRLTRGSRWLLGLVVPLHLARDVGGKDRLQPRSWPATDDPSVRGGYRASKAGGELRGSQGKAFVPSHGKRIPAEIKNAMRKINLAMGYAMRILCACPTPNNSPNSPRNTAKESRLTTPRPSLVEQALMLPSATPLKIGSTKSRDGHSRKSPTIWNTGKGSGRPKNHGAGLNPPQR